MAVYAGPEIPDTGLVLALDGANYKSFKGEATTNLSRNSRDFSGTAYASSDEWTSEPTRLTKTYISALLTPIGNGATLIQESGTAGFHHLSRYGGGDENGLHSLSCYVYPLTNDITDFCIGLLGDAGNNISFNLNTRAITYGGGISNRNAFITPVIGYDGWYRVGANIEGRSGGWVGCFGYSSYTSYTGISGAKKCYITGIQYESKSSPTSFVEAQTTRGTTVATGGGWADLSGNSNNGELVNGVRESSDNLGSLLFDGVDDRIECGNFSVQYLTISTWVYKTSSATHQGICRKQNGWAVSQYNGTLQVAPGTSWTFYDTGYTIPLNTWVNIVYTYSGTGSTGSQTVYINGSSIYSTTAGSGAISANSNAVRVGYDDNNWFWGGRISQTQIYNRALSATEVAQNFNALRGRFGI